jgi:hypothetical protein
MYRVVGEPAKRLAHPEIALVPARFAVSANDLLSNDGLGDVWNG